MNPTDTENARYPEFTRLPRPGTRCPMTGLSRTTICELIKEGHVKAKKVKKRGRLRGITLVVTDSLLGYLKSLDDAS